METKSLVAILTSGTGDPVEPLACIGLLLRSVR